MPVPANAAPHSDRRPGQTHRQALDALELHIARVGSWVAGNEAEFDRRGRLRVALGLMQLTANDMKENGKESGALFGAGADAPLAILGPGGDYRRDVCGDARTGRIDVNG